jgi:hypothetical protein
VRLYGVEVFVVVIGGRCFELKGQQFLATWNVLCIDAPAIVMCNTAVELEWKKGHYSKVVPDPEDTIGWNRRACNQMVKVTKPPICVKGELFNQRQTSRSIKHWRSQWYISNDADTGEIRVSS